MGEGMGSEWRVAGGGFVLYYIGLLLSYNEMRSEKAG